MRGDVVVAPATPWGRAALALVRLSGPGCHAVVAACARPLRPELPVSPGRPRRVALFDAAGVFDDGVLVLGAGPATATGEDTAEVGLHGNPRLVERFVAAACAAGARLAEPGELTRRALLHGKLDLVQAEAVGQLVDAVSDDGIALARAAAAGAVSAELATLRDALVEVAAELEARLDWPDDELAVLGDDAVIAQLQGVAAQASRLVESYRAGRVWVHGARVALVGPVNAGKSSLFNALLGQRRALVHDTPGTTRDVVEATTRWDGVQVTLLDTAGERDTDDPVEAAGLALGRELVADVDLVVLVTVARPEGPDAVERLLLERTADRPRVVVVNGIDRCPDVVDDGRLAVCALDGRGVDGLRAAVRVALLAEAPADARRAIASVRQRDLLTEVVAGCDEAARALSDAGPAAAADAVVRAVGAVDAVTGATTREDVLDAVFRRFCIGK